MTTTKFQDPRAKAIAQQIEAINNTAYSEAYDPILHNQVVQGGLSPIEGTLRYEIFMNRVKEAARKREIIWKEQIEQGISGIEWYTITYGGISVELPRLQENLKFAPGDQDILMQSKFVAFNFLNHWNKNFKLWRFSESSWHRTNLVDFYIQYLQREWIEIWVDDSISTNLLEDGSYGEEPTFAINAFCCWGNPSETHASTAYPESGSVWFQWNNFTPWR